MTANHSKSRADEAAKVPSAEERAENLQAQIEALLAMDASGTLVPHGIGGLARELLTKASELIARLEVEKDARWDVICAAASLNMENMLLIADLKAALKEAVAMAGKHRGIAIDRSVGYAFGDSLPKDEDWHAFKDRVEATLSKPRPEAEGTKTVSADTPSNEQTPQSLPPHLEAEGEK